MLPPRTFIVLMGQPTPLVLCVICYSCYVLFMQLKFILVAVSNAIQPDLFTVFIRLVQSTAFKSSTSLFFVFYFLFLSVPQLISFLVA